MIQKINQDIDTTRHQKNMTNSQKKNDNSLKEGVIVNSYIKDPLLSLDETLDTLVISNTEVKLPKKLKEKDIDEKNILLPICITSALLMSIITGFTYFMKNFSKNVLESSKEFLLPGITRNHCINNEIHQSIFSMIQSPNRKTILASTGVITLAMMAYLSKILIDGMKEVWVKKKEADIQKKLQENLIEVETQSFSGKIQIIRSLLATKAKIFKNELYDSPNFKSNEEKNYKKK